MIPSVDSHACDIVSSASHPAYADGGPCAFRAGTEPSRAEETVTLARLCVEGFRPFYCHEHEHLCRGFVAAMNIRGLPETNEDRRLVEAAGAAADVLSACIASAAALLGGSIPESKRR